MRGPCTTDPEIYVRELYFLCLISDNKKMCNYNFLSYDIFLMDWVAAGIVKCSPVFVRFLLAEKSGYL